MVRSRKGNQGKTGRVMERGLSKKGRRRKGGLGNKGSESCVEEHDCGERSVPQFCGGTAIGNGVNNGTIQFERRAIPRHEQLVPLRNHVPVRVELDASEVWSVQGQRGTCVASRHPPVNLGRNLFPSRRFSYHTRVSRFNGTARQPSP
jgi:hypothetical protein